jgi:hypothetical protein
MTVWIVILEDRRQDISVDIYASKEGAHAAAESLAADYSADHGGKYPLTRTDHGNDVVSWYRDDGPRITLESKDVEL